MHTRLTFTILDKQLRLLQKKKKFNIWSKNSTTPAKLPEPPELSGTYLISKMYHIRICLIVRMRNFFNPQRCYGNKKRIKALKK